MAREDTPGDLTDDDDELDCEMDVDARSGSRPGRKPSAKPPPAPSLSPLKVPKGISDEILSLFDFTAKPTDAASLARSRVSKVLGKKRLERVVDNALASGRVEIAELATLYGTLTRSGKSGMRNLGRILADRTGEDLAAAESELEERLYSLLVDSGLPPPARQFRAP